MKIFLPLIVFALLSAAPAAAQSSPSLLVKAGLAAYVALHAVDLHQTLSCLDAGRCVEANPLAKGIVQRPVLAVAVTAGATAASAWAIYRLHEAHPRLAKWLTVAGVAGMGAVVARNAWVLR